MSLSKPVEKSTKNPVVRYYTFNGATGTLSYYDKETEQKVEVSDAFVFVPTDERSAVEGFCSKKQMGFRSNEVIKTATEKLTIRWNTTGYQLFEGLYKDIKDKIKAQGGKYIKSIYGISKIDGEWQMINLKLKGASFSSWIELDKKIKGGLIGLTIAMKKGPEKKTGMVNYFEPVFKVKQTPEDIHKIALDKDAELQEYFISRDTPLSKTNLDELIEQPLSQEEKAELKELKKNAKKVKQEIKDEEIDNFFDEL